MSAGSARGLGFGQPYGPLRPQQQQGQQQEYANAALDMMMLPITFR